jgi:hypothetical protein
MLNSAKIWFRLFNRGLDMSGIKPIITLLVCVARRIGLFFTWARHPPQPQPDPHHEPQVLEGQLATAAAGFNETGKSTYINRTADHFLVAQALARRPFATFRRAAGYLQNGQMVVGGKVEIGSLPPRSNRVRTFGSEWKFQ